MRIGTIDLGDRPLLLAPMEDVSDPPFRIICKRYGADMLYTEFISSGGLTYGAEGSVQKLEFYEEERPVGIQIFGGEVDQVREAARIADAQEPDLIDINFGCPVKKVVCKDGGAGILRNLEKMEAITAAVVQEATRPVTVKTRLGWNDESIRIEEVARMLEGVGIAALAVHGRTRAQMYRGDARWEWFPKIKAALRDIPFIGNGDATTPERVRDMFDETGCDGVMIGRGAIGNPWIFRDARALLEHGEVPDPPSWEERVAVVAEHLTLKCAWLGERKGVLEMRRMYGGYFKGHRGASQLRALLMEHQDKDGVLEVLLNWSPDDVETAVPVARAVKPAAIPAKLPRKARLPQPAERAA
ncbi:tRNA dihydrouridine synthase DusB [Rubrivirga marina]|uniref:tRNA-dihydrouridine synthase n=1 Tax=Rubrivirga marina TaxID=1196024 RepID=A0A271J0G9_9BACT|nr:tRNA dihydrouridine synthase DusB [Rubrivirga marina]PAP76229.1 tRNA dihydrouridine synthase DusB [Rubrivirga marina]